MKHVGDGTRFDLRDLVRRSLSMSRTGVRREFVRRWSSQARVAGFRDSRMLKH